MKKTGWILSAAAAVALAIAGCTALPTARGNADLDGEAQRMLATGFHDHGIAKMDRITKVDDTVKACNAADISGKPLDDATARRIEAENMKTIHWPSDGRFLGDWKRGEQIAQSGRGQTWTDKPGASGGGNCYN